MNATNSDSDAVGIVLAAGRGSRMRSRIPKPLHTLAGRELIRYPIEALKACGVSRIVVVASPDNRDAMVRVLGDEVVCAVQGSPDGTADAVACGLKALPVVPRMVVVLAGDTPLVRPESLLKLMEDHRTDPHRRMTILSAADAFGPDLGHIRRAGGGATGGTGAVLGIEEAADRAEICYGPAEVNTGVYCFDGPVAGQQPRRSSDLCYWRTLRDFVGGHGVGCRRCGGSRADCPCRRGDGGERPGAIGRRRGGSAGSDQPFLDV